MTYNTTPPRLEINSTIRLGKHKLESPAICAAIIGEDIASMEEDLKRALEKGPDLIELRLDKLKDTSDWTELLREEVPMIVTNRKKDEGGFFEGSEEERIEILYEAIDRGAPCIDIELSTLKNKRDELIEKATKEGTSVITSFHDFNKVPPVENLMEKTREMFESGCDIGKIIGFARDKEDSLRILEFLIRASRKTRVPVISFAMGEAGEFTRITTPLLGSPVTYASIGEKTAPGQLSLENEKKILEKFKN